MINVINTNSSPELESRFYKAKSTNYSNLFFIVFSILLKLVNLIISFVMLTFLFLEKKKIDGYGYSKWLKELVEWIQNTLFNKIFIDFATKTTTISYMLIWTIFFSLFLVNSKNDKKYYKRWNLCYKARPRLRQYKIYVTLFQRFL